MSIIQEALKKIDGEAKKPEVIAGETAQPDPIELRKPVKAIVAHGNNDQSQGPRIIYFVIIAVLTIILAGIVVKASRTPAAQIKNIAPILPKIETISQIRKERGPENRRNIGDLGSFILDGIMYIADRPRAIINNIIVGEGETVGGANVEKIRKDSVVLKYNESEVTLKLNR